VQSTGNPMFGSRANASNQRFSSSLAQNHTYNNAAAIGFAVGKYIAISFRSMLVDRAIRVIAGLI
jgi:hypothetical protein